MLFLAAILAACAPKGVEVVVAEPLETKMPPSPTNQPATAIPTRQDFTPTLPPTQTITLTPTSHPTPEVEWGSIDPSGQLVDFWHALTYSREETLLEIVRKFNRTNEWGITVKPVSKGRSGELFTETSQVLNSPESPHLVLAYQDQAIEYWLAQAVVDLNSLVDDPNWGFSQAEQQDFFPGIWAQDAIPAFNGARLGMPAYRAMDVLYYNADWLAELNEAGLIDFEGPPQSPSQFREAACAAVEQSFSQSTSAEGMGYELSLSASRFASWTFAFGGEVFDTQNNRYSYDSPAAVEAMQYLQDLFLSGCARLVQGSYGDQEDFGAGKLLFAIGTSTGLPFYEREVKEGARFNWNVAAIAHSDVQPAQNAYGPSFSLLKTTSEGELAAWLFIKYFSELESQSEWAVASDYFPVRQSAGDALEMFFESSPRHETIFDLFSFGKFEPNVPGYESARELVREAMAAIAEGADVPETLVRLNEQVNSILIEAESYFYPSK